MDYFLRSDWGIAPGARKDLAGACQGHSFVRFGGFFKVPYLACLGGAFGKLLWPFFVHVFVRNPYTKLCTDSVHNLGRIAYTEIRSRDFFLRRPDFRFQNPTQFLVRILAQIFVRIPYTKPQNASPLARTSPGPYGPRVRIPYTFLVAF